MNSLRNLFRDDEYDILIDCPSCHCEPRVAKFYTNSLTSYRYRIFCSVCNLSTRPHRFKRDAKKEWEKVVISRVQ